MKSKLSIPALIVLAILLVVAWFFRPLFHGYIMSIWINPLGTVLMSAAVLALISAGVIYSWHFVRYRRHGQGAKAPWITGLVALAGLLFLTSLIYSPLAKDFSLAKAYQTYNFEDVKALPNDSQSRLVPLAVAERFGADSLQRSTEHAHTWHPQLWDGKFSWVAGLTPSGTVRQWLDQASGVQTVDATTAQRSTAVVDQKFKYSEGVSLTDNIRWQLYKQRYLINIPEIYYGKVAGKVYAVAPILSYRGLLIRYPVLDGAFVVAPDGNIEELTVEQAQQHPAVKASGRLYPESYTRFVHESYALKGGVMNKWFRHVDQTEISDPAGEANSQPYMLSTSNGLKWVTAADPWGQSFGIYKIFITDAITGKNHLYSIPQDAALTGAAQAIGYVKSARPQYNWHVPGTEDSSSSGNITAIEPRPLFVDNELHWMVSVTTTEAKGINETCFVHAKNNQVVCAVNDNEIKSFIATGSVKAKEPAPAEGAETPATNTSRERIEKLESTLNQALKELQELKAAQP